jgi:hypothetical protein
MTDPRTRIVRRGNRHDHHAAEVRGVTICRKAVTVSHTSRRSGRPSGNQRRSLEMAPNVAGALPPARGCASLPRAAIGPLSCGFNRGERRAERIRRDDLSAIRSARRFAHPM